MNKILLIIFLTVSLNLSYASAQENSPKLLNLQPTTFSLKPDQEKLFTLQMKRDDFAELTWLASDEISLSVEIFDIDHRSLYESLNADGDNVWFVAPENGQYLVVVKFRSYNKSQDSQRISLQYNNKFKLPASAKLQNARRINGYDIRIMTAKEDEDNSSLVLIEKAGILKKAMKASGSGSPDGFSFADDITKAYTAADKASVALVKSTLDKTGDGIPDVVIDYYSGGAHCCASTYFINLGEKVAQVDFMETAHDGLVAIGKNQKGGLVFSVSDTSFGYWQTGFAGSAFPIVILDFSSGKLRPNFARMKKNPPSLNSLKAKARIAKYQLNSLPYLGEENSQSELYKENATYETVFWGEMLDLIYSGNDELAWQYLDLVWPAEKRGKEIFATDLKNKINESSFWQMIEQDNKK